MRKNMKKIVSLILVLIIIVTIAACGNQKKSKTSKKEKNKQENIEKKASNEYLPSRIENINNGGEIPEGNEAGKQMESANYPKESLWGTWVPENSADIESQEKTFASKTTTYIDEETGEESKATKIKLKIFPQSLKFAAPWDNIGFFAIKAVDMPVLRRLDDAENEQEKTEAYENTVLGEALQNINLGQGRIEYNYEKTGDLSVWDAGGYNFAYGVSGDTLAIGLLSSSDEEADNSNIQEIDYKISFVGWKLTLSYGDKSVTYIPEDFDSSKIIDLYQNGLEKGYQTTDGILGITYRGDLQQIMYDLHEGYVDADIELNEDGKAMISASNGKKNELKYTVSEDCLTLFSDKEEGVYSSWRTGLDSVNAQAGSRGNKLGLGDSGASIKVGTETIPFSNESDLKQLLDKGFTTAVDTNQAVKSCVVSDDITLEKSGSTIKVKVINPWKSPVVLSACKICSVYVEDKTGTISSADNCEIGTTQYNTIENFYEAPYKKTSEVLLYKVSGAFDMKHAFDVKDTEKGELALESENDLEILYHFKNRVLDAFEVRCPSLLYNGMQDNMSEESLANMNTATMSTVVETRNDVMAKLKSAFKKADIDVNINETTGEIVMDTNVLFGYDSSELSEEGKKYINRFMGVYSSVILDDSLKDTISEVRFEGHTDSNGTYDYNLELSQKRAEAVEAYCLNSDTTKMSENQKKRLNQIGTAKGYSFSDPVYDENGKEDEEASRRVAIKFYIK